MNIYSNLMLNIPIQFYDVCTIYPITVEDMVKYYSSDDSRLIFEPFLITHKLLSDDLINKPIYEIIIEDQSLLQLMAVCIIRLCKCTVDDITFKNDNEICILNNKSTINKDNFEEFADVVATMLYINRSKLKKQEDEIPKFETEEGKQRWLKYQELKKKYAPKVNGSELNNLIMYSQFGGNYYIPDEEIMKWTYWKLIYSQEVISNKQSYDINCQAVLQGADKRIIKDHWTKQVYK